ncbi:class I tRNA ligase family protein, partial [Candidatus Pacearchaeota archaeon]|nr:class I tRNA ligase family protein [Candidatus Pacearchaeota archaeon]
MPLKIYSTLSRKKEIFKPIKKDEVNLFVCGPTVYDYAHLGHAKTYTQFDVIVKYLRYKGYKVFYLQNITDIDDKIIKRANEENTDWKEIVSKYRKEYFEDMKSLGIDSVNKYADATNFIPEIISQVKRLIEK